LSPTDRDSRSIQVQAAEALLRGIGAAPQAPADIAEAALALSALARRDLDLQPYRHHLAAIAQQVAQQIADAETRGADPAGDALRRRVSALNATLIDRFGYEGDRATYDDLDNADLARVIDRRRGLPVALGILWMHAARSQGWPIAGLAFPGHFLLRLGEGGPSAIIDPFDGGRIHSAASLRSLLKTAAGAEAELAPEHYAAVDDREVLLRLQNNIKLRLIRDGRLAEAAAVLDRMLMLAPEQAPLWRESGLVHARLGNLRHATEALEAFLDRAQTPEERRQVAQILQDLKGRLN
jgi:regulator of sirC expression with transglutaminase-like and TPR domain